MPMWSLFAIAVTNHRASAATCCYRLPPVAKVEKKDFEDGCGVGPGLFGALCRDFGLGSKDVCWAWSVEIKGPKDPGQFGPFA